MEFVNLKRQYKSIKREIDHAISEVITDTAFISGKYAKLFEHEFAEIYGVRHVVSCANGTDALFIALKALSVGNGDEVITVSNTWISSSEVVSQTGATPVFIDIEEDYFMMDITKVEDKINPRVKAIIAVHLRGNMLDIVMLKRLCLKYNIALIEDCAQSHFSEFMGKRAGLYGDIATFSFYPGKNLGAFGDAGCIITNSARLAEFCRRYANHGSLVKHEHKIEGINSRMDGIQANVLRVKLRYILEWTEKRIELAKLYYELLEGIEGIRLISIDPRVKHTYHVFQVVVKERERLIDFLKFNDVPTAIHYPTPLPFLPCYEHLNLRESDFDITRKYQFRVLSLPICAHMRTEEVEKVATLIRIFYEKDRNN